MTGKTFINKLSNSEYDLLQEFLDILKKNDIKFCLIGGLAVNAYAEPVVSLDMDIVISSVQIKDIIKVLGKNFSIKKQAHSINLYSKKSDLRIQITTDKMYQGFIGKAKIKTVLGYKLPVARVEDVLKGKLWAYKDIARRPSKRQKDLADIVRLVETQPRLSKLLPASIKINLK